MRARPAAARGGARRRSHAAPAGSAPAHAGSWARRRRARGVRPQLRRAPRGSPGCSSRSRPADATTARRPRRSSSRGPVVEGVEVRAELARIPVLRPGRRRDAEAHDARVRAARQRHAQRGQLVRSERDSPRRGSPPPWLTASTRCRMPGKSVGSLESATTSSPPRHRSRRPRDAWARTRCRPDRARRPWWSRRARRRTFQRVVPSSVSRASGRPSGVIEPSVSTYSTRTGRHAVTDDAVPGRSAPRAHRFRRASGRSV